MMIDNSSGGTSGLSSSRFTCSASFAAAGGGLAGQREQRDDGGKSSEAAGHHGVAIYGTIDLDDFHGNGGRGEQRRNQKRHRHDRATDIFGHDRVDLTLGAPEYPIEHGNASLLSLEHDENRLLLRLPKRADDKANGGCDGQRRQRLILDGLVDSGLEVVGDDANLLAGLAALVSDVASGLLDAGNDAVDLVASLACQVFRRVAAVVCAAIE
jgi:hypothetical protein